MNLLKESDASFKGVRSVILFDEHPMARNVHVSNSEGFLISIEKANRLIKERGTVVYLRQENLNNGATYIWNRTTKSPEMEVTHRALLINIEPIEKDSAEKIVEDWLALQSKPQREYVREESQLLDRAKALREGK